MRTSVVLTTLCLILCTSSILSAQAETVFRGIPSTRVTTDGETSQVEAIVPTTAGNLQVVISRIGDRYYWASRENIEVVRRDGGAFTTYIAVTGAGYVRILNPEFKQAAALMGAAEKAYDYVEHITIGLRTIAYYGTIREVAP